MRCFCVLMVKYIYVWHMVVTSAGVSVLIGLVLTCFIGALKTYALLAHLLITLFLFIWQVICSWSLITRLQKFVLFRLLCEVTAYSMLFKNGFRISIAEFLRPQSFQNDKILLVQSNMQ